MIRHQLHAAVALITAFSAATLCFAANAQSTSVPAAKTVVDQFEANAGVHLRLRRNHVHGVCVTGYFDSSGALAPYSTAQVFAAGLRTPVIGRFSVPGGNPQASDAVALVRGLALSLEAANGEVWRTAMLSAPVFTAPTPETFFQQLQAAQPLAATGKPDPARQAQAAAANPRGAAFVRWSQTATPSVSYATQSYGSLVAFFLVNAQGKRQPVRWRFVPTEVDASGMGEDGLSDLRQRLRHGPLRWNLVMTLAREGDALDDATNAWPEDRTHIDAGTLVLRSAEPDAEGSCRDLVFDPLLLPPGIAPSPDALLQFRSDVYRESFHRRSQERGVRP